MVLAAGGLLGLLQQDPEKWFRWQSAGESGLDDAAIDDLVFKRTEARKAKDFAESDRIRDELSEAGVVLEDKPEGTIWRRV
jgi:cysteinyl-tRNA synthetase